MKTLYNIANGYTQVQDLKNQLRLHDNCTSHDVLGGIPSLAPQKTTSSLFAKILLIPSMSSHYGKGVGHPSSQGTGCSTPVSCWKMSFISNSLLCGASTLYPVLCWALRRFQKTVSHDPCPQGSYSPMKEARPVHLE